MQPIILRNPETGKEKSWQVPTEMNELTQDQYLGAVAVLNNLHERPELQWALIPLIMGISVKDMAPLNEVQRVELLGQLEFVFDDDKLPYKAMITSFSTLQYKAIHCPRKIARALGTTLYGPGDVLGNLSFGEFMAAESRMDIFRKNPAGNHAALNEFCGILFRKTSGERRKYTDKRIRFEEGLIPEYAKVFSAVSKDVKSAILMNYNGAKGMFPKLYRNLFPGTPGGFDGAQDGPPRGDTNAPTGQPAKSQSLSWLNMLIGMADRDVTKFAQIKASSLHEALKTIDESIAHNKKMKDEVEKQRRK